MGYEIAAAAERRGADVVLVSGPTSLACPDGVRRIDVTTAAEMYDVVHLDNDADLIVMVAAVSDFTPEEETDSKIKKGGDHLTLKLKATKDILASLGEKKRPDQTLVGFALETDNAEANAKAKLAKKNLDWIVLNNPTEEGAGFGTETNRVTLMGRDGSTKDLPLMAKREVAEFLLDHITGS